jgi:hypothetical protein
MGTGRLVAGVAVLSLAVSGAVALRAGAPQTSAPRAAARPAIDLAAFAPRSAVAALDVVARRFDAPAAMTLVTFMDRYWRNAGNEGFNASLDRIRQRLEASGFAGRDAGPASGASVWIESSGGITRWAR